jgi:hypothetical protein
MGGFGEFLVAIIIASGFGLIVAKDAKEYRMNPLFWGLGTTLLLIIFLPLYIFIRIYHKKENDKQDPS